MDTLKSLFRRLRNTDPTERFEEEFQDLIEQGEEQGRITSGEGEMIQGIFELGVTVAREIMVPRTSVVAVPADASLGQVLDTIIQFGHTRLPAFESDIDHIEGVLLAKDLLAYWGLPREEPLPRTIFRPPYFVPESKKIVDLLAELRAMKTHIAIVLDEYGGTAGIVTLEDVIEEIVGDIRDEYDQEETMITETDQGIYLVDARIGIWDLADHLDTKFPEGEYDTLGGFITELVGRVPQENDQVHFQNLLFTIKSADERKINQVEVKTDAGPA
ncbi:MAG: HlyC/CorC family transporter [Deltaproteobacteria bacterium]|nr:HlyC/CorC family transporter [Deltaproteobacteria bacterium]